MIRNLKIKIKCIPPILQRVVGRKIFFLSIFPANRQLLELADTLPITYIYKIRYLISNKIFA